MNRMERIINLLFQIENEEDYAEVVGKQKMIREILGHVLYVFEIICIDDLASLTSSS